MDGVEENGGEALADEHSLEELSQEHGWAQEFDVIEDPELISNLWLIYQFVNEAERGMCAQDQMCINTPEMFDEIMRDPEIAKFVLFDEETNDPIGIYILVLNLEKAKIAYIDKQTFEDKYGQDGERPIYYALGTAMRFDKMGQGHLFDLMAPALVKTYQDGAIMGGDVSGNINQFFAKAIYKIFRRLINDNILPPALMYIDQHDAQNYKVFDFASCKSQDKKDSLFFIDIDGIEIDKTKIINLCQVFLQKLIETIQISSGTIKINRVYKERESATGFSAVETNLGIFTSSIHLNNLKGYVLIDILVPKVLIQLIQDEVLTLIKDTFNENPQNPRATVIDEYFPSEVEGVDPDNPIYDPEGTGDPELKPFGYHSILELDLGDEELDLDTLYGLLDQLPGEIDMEKQAPPIVQKGQINLEGETIVGWVPLVESSITALYIKSNNKIQLRLDVFSCVEFKSKKILKFLDSMAIKRKNCTVKMVLRGIKHTLKGD
jgi:hypothetical protein